MTDPKQSLISSALSLREQENASTLLIPIPDTDLYVAVGTAKDLAQMLGGVDEPLED